MKSRKDTSQPTEQPWLACMAAHPAVVSLLLALATLAVFRPVTGHDFINFDDPSYVTENLPVQQGLTLAGVRWAFTTGHAANWHPLTWLSHMTDMQLLGKGPAGPHLVNLLFHIANTVLVFLVLRRLTGSLWSSAIVAGLFGWHPLHVESVAWVAERKDVLSGLFFLLTIWAYARHAGKAESRKQKAESGETRAEAQRAQSNPNIERRTSNAVWYSLALVFFALGLMSKPMLVTTPFVLLLLDYWPLRRWQCPAPGSRATASLKPLVWEKAPFFLLTAISCAVTVVAQRHGGAVQSLGDTSLGARAANALVSYTRYVGKTIWPTGLATPYPNPSHWPVAEVLLALGLILALTLAAVWLGRRSPWLVTGWFWFVGMLVPVIGLVQAGDQSMADRYTYLPLIGVFLIVVWGVSEALSRWRLPPAVDGVVAGLVLAACAVQTRQQLSYWRNSETLFTHATAVTKGNWIAWFNLGCALEKQGRMEEALAAYRRTVEIKPAYADGQNRLGCALAARQQYAEAIACFEAVLRAKPDFVEVHNNLAEAYRLLGKPDLANQHQQLFLQKAAANPKALINVADGLAGQGQFAAAVPYYEAALRAGADPATARLELANTLAKLGRLDEAIDHYKQVLRQKPAYAEAHNRLGMALAAKGALADAETEFREALRLEPNLAPALVNLGRVLTAERKLDEAIAVFRAAAPLAPANPDLHAHFAIALAMKGDTDEAAEQFRETLRYRPTDVVAHFNLGKILSVKGQTNEAIAHFTEALRLKPDFANARQELEALRAAQGPGKTR